MAKVLTLLQPWAQLVVQGDKQFETRAWSTPYTGELYIHSSARFHGADLELCQTHPDFKACIPDPLALKTGYIIGKVNLVRCIPTDQHEAHAYITHKIGGLKARREFIFGNYMPRRFAWEFTDPVIFDKPIFARGKLSIWTIDLQEVAHA